MYNFSSRLYIIYVASLRSLRCLPLIYTYMYMHIHVHVHVQYQEYCEPLLINMYMYK